MSDNTFENPVKAEPSIAEEYIDKIDQENSDDEIETSEYKFSDEELLDLYFNIINECEKYSYSFFNRLKSYHLYELFESTN
jgi:hypothetical protein